MECGPATLETAGLQPRYLPDVATGSWPRAVGAAASGSSPGPIGATAPGSSPEAEGVVAKGLRPEFVTTAAAGLQPKSIHSTPFITVRLQPEPVTSSTASLHPKLVECEANAGLQAECGGLRDLPDMHNILTSFGVNINNLTIVELKDYNFRDFNLSGTGELSISQRVKLFRRNSQAPSGVNTTSLGAL